MSWLGICKLCGYEQDLGHSAPPWFRCGGKIVACPKCNKYLVRQECEEATRLRRMRPNDEVKNATPRPVQTFLEVRLCQDAK